MMMKLIMIVIVMVEENFHVKLFDYVFHLVLINPIEEIKAYYLFFK